MGIYAEYVAVPPADLDEAQRNEAFWGTLSFAPPDAYLKCDIHRYWSTLWYLLDPEARVIANLKVASNQLGKAVMGAHIFCRHFCVLDAYRQEVESAYNHPRYLTPEEVRDAARALQAVTRDVLLEAYDAPAMERRVYALCSEDDAWMWFERLRAFYVEAARRGYGVVLHIR